jgi:REP element-mobilizing transposase RayT
MNNIKRKEFYRHMLPHFQVPGQVFFVTWCLKSAVPPKALATYKQQLMNLKSDIFYAQQSGKEAQIVETLQMQYHIARRKYVKAYDDLLDSTKDLKVDLSSSSCIEILKETLLFYETKKIENFAFSIMPNHVHWVFRTFEVGEDGNPVFLQDILQSVKRYSSNFINKAIGSTGKLWQKESFDTTIRDEKHLWNAMEYTLNNPVKAGLVSSPEEWTGSWVRK